MKRFDFAQFILKAANNFVQRIFKLMIFSSNQIALVTTMLLGLQIVRILSQFIAIAFFNVYNGRGCGSLADNFGRTANPVFEKVNSPGCKSFPQDSNLFLADVVF